MAHAKIFSPSAAHRNMRCYGAAAMEHGIPNRSNEFADSGTADHEIAAKCLENGTDAASFIGQTITVIERDEDGAELGKRDFLVDEDRAEAIQVYLGYVRSLVDADAILLVEQRLDFSKAIGIPDQFGTGDAVILHPETRHGDMVDLKGGSGVKVYATNPDGTINEQLLTYGVGTMETYEALCEFDTMTLHIVQPRLDHIDSVTVTREQLLEHARLMRKAALNMAIAKMRRQDGLDLDAFLTPGEKQCQWCKAKAKCGALQGFVHSTVAAEFEDLSIVDVVPALPKQQDLGAVYAKLPLIEQWIKEVKAEVSRQVSAGFTVIGSDGQRMKLVKGRGGDRVWKDKDAAAAQLAGIMSPDELYEPAELVGVPKVAKKYDKKKTAATWALIQPLIYQPPGKPTLALGSDPRPEYVPDATADFDDLSDPSN